MPDSGPSKQTGGDSVLMQMQRPESLKGISLLISLLRKDDTLASVATKKE